jgi:beta-lactam-binding protein with PASTA domain
MVDVPDTVGHDQRVAELELRRAGLEVGVTVRLPITNAAEGTVLAQDPPAHAQDIAKPTVNLLVAAPDDETVDGYVMPDLTGLPVVSAQSALIKAGIKAATPVYVSVPVPPVGSGNALPVLPVKPGAVIAQIPPVGARVDQSTKVRLTVAK